MRAAVRDPSTPAAFAQDDKSRKRTRKKKKIQGILRLRSLHLRMTRRGEVAVRITVNTDDIVMFGQSVSHEFLNLYKAGCLNEIELDQIRENGLSA